MPPVWTCGADELGFMFYDVVVYSSRLSVRIADTDGAGDALGSALVDTHYTPGGRSAYENGRIDIYHDITPDYGTAGNGPNAGPYAWITGGGAILDDYPGVSFDAASGDLQLWLTGQLTPMYLDPVTGAPIVYDITVSVFWNDLNANGTPDVGDWFGGIDPDGTNSGTAYMDILGGTAEHLFGKDQFVLNFSGFTSDIMLQQTFISGGHGWQVTSSDPIRAYGNPTCIDIEKEVSVDGGVTWYDADDCADAPGTAMGGEYRLTVKNCGGVVLTDVVITDDVLGLSESIADLAVGEVRIFTKAQFAKLDKPDLCPLTPGDPGVIDGAFFNTAMVTATGNGTIVTDEDPACVVCRGGEGCTPGYWKNHPDSWAPTGLSPEDDFDATFGVDFFDPDITLLQAVRAKGGGINVIARHGTAALLNALHPVVNYPFTEAEVIAFVQARDVDALVEANEFSEACPAEFYSW